MDRPHIPALRLGRAYESLEKVEVRDHRNGEPVAAVSQVNAGIIRRDLDRIETSRVALKKFTCAQLIEMSSHAADVFMNNTLPLGDKGDTQSPQQYIETLSDTSGLPHALVRRNMNRISTVLSQMETILRGLTRGLDLSIIDKGFGEQGGIAVSYFATTNSLGVIMPSNSPAVNSLWLPAIALKVPVVLEARPRGTIYSLAADPVVSRGWRACGSVWLLPHRPRRSRRDPAALWTRAALW